MMKAITTMSSDSAMHPIIEGQKTMLRRVMFPQPPEGSTLAGYHGGITKFLKPDGLPFYVPLHYDVGEQCYFKETWGIDEAGNYLYKADGGHAPDGWNHSMYMPAEAARVFVELTEIHAERLQDIPTGDIPKMGYPKGTKLADIPRLWRKALSGHTGKRGGKWSDNPWVWVISFRTVKAPKNLPKLPPKERKELQQVKSERNTYKVYLRETGELIASGTAEQCAEAMDRKKTGFYDVVQKSKKRPGYLYRVEVFKLREHPAGGDQIKTKE